MQRDLVKELDVERATLSTTVSVLVRKGFVEQTPCDADQRQKLVRMTAVGTKLWEKLPDLAVIHDIAFGDVDDASIATVIQVLLAATLRLENFTDRS